MHKYSKVVQRKWILQNELPFAALQVAKFSFFLEYSLIEVIIFGISLMLPFLNAVKVNSIEIQANELTYCIIKSWKFILRFFFLLHYECKRVLQNYHMFEETVLGDIGTRRYMLQHVSKFLRLYSMVRCVVIYENTIANLQKFFYTNSFYNIIYLKED